LERDVVAQSIATLEKACRDNNVDDMLHEVNALVPERSNGNGAGHAQNAAASHS
jgi:hypothetical protein